MTGRRLTHAACNRNDAERRWIALGLSTASAAVMTVISAYQLGLLRRLPDPALPGFDSQSVVGSRRAYAILGIPDGLLGLASYAVTAVLAAAGGPDRAGRHPLLSLSFAAKVLFDAANALRLAWYEWAKERALCSYCLLATAFTLATVPVALPGARHALRTLLSRRIAGRRSYAL